MRLVVTVVIGAVLTLTGCGESNGSQAEGGDVEQTPAPPTGDEAAREAGSTPEGDEAPAGAQEFTGQDRTNYEQARGVCSALPPEKVAQDLGINVDVGTSEGLVRIAEKYAEGSRPNFRQAVFEGCLADVPRHVVNV